MAGLGSLGNMSGTGRKKQMNVAQAAANKNQAKRKAVNSNHNRNLLEDEERRRAGTAGAPGVTKSVNQYLGGGIA